MRCPECARNMERTEDGRLWVCRDDGAAVEDTRVISHRQHQLEMVRRCRRVLETAERRAEARRAAKERDGPHLQRVA